jgi:hypothetical protein
MTVQAPKLLLAAVMFLGLAGCSASEVLSPVPLPMPAPTSSGPVLPPPPPEAAPGCNPVLGDDCLTPFPSTFFEVPDPTTATGVRLALAADVLPQITPPLSTERYNQKDGFSPAAQFMVYFKAGVDETELPTLDELDATVNPTSVVQVVDFETGERVPVFAEMDVNGNALGRHALMVRPMTRLRPERRYVIAIVGLHDKKGDALAPAPFVALRDKNPLSKSLAPVADRYEEIFAALESAGVPRAGLTLAWDVITASDGTATSHLQDMRDQALGVLGQVTYTSMITDTPSDPNVLRTVIFTVKGPSFLADDSGHSTMNFDAQGNPALRGFDDMPVVVKIPQCALTAKGPLPLIVFGHGLFGDAADTLATPLLEQIGNQACVVFIGTDWIGLASSDLPTLAQYLPQDLNNVYLVTDRLQQAHVNAQVMTRFFLQTLKDDPAVAVNGHAVTDGSVIGYFGVSDGGIQGATFMGISQDVERGALNVPGCEWSLMIQRSVDFAQLSPIIDAALPDPLDLEILLGLTQSEWDYADPATFAPHLILDPLPGVNQKHILLQESEGDAQVPNIATRVLARTMGVPGLDLVTPVFGIPQQQAPLDSAYTQWNSHHTPLPPTTDTALSSDNGAHDAVYQYVPAQTQLLTFLQPGGQVIQTCQGPCSFGP